MGQVRGVECDMSQTNRNPDLEFGIEYWVTSRPGDQILTFIQVDLSPSTPLPIKNVAGSDLLPTNGFLFSFHGLSKWKSNSCWGDFLLCLVPILSQIGLLRYLSRNPGVCRCWSPFPPCVARSAARSFLLIDGISFQGLYSKYSASKSILLIQVGSPSLITS